MTEADIRAQLDLILSSPEFDVPERARRFLAHIVEETIAGRADRIKAYSIAMEVFGRDASFDAQSDPVVRIEAGRIRRGLERYYLVAGQGDPIVITVPKGGYVPVFTASDRRLAGTDAAEAPLGQPAAPPRSRTSWHRMALAAALLVVTIFTVHRFLGWSDAAESWLADTLNAGKPRPSIPTLLVRPFEDLSGRQDSAIIAKGLTNEIIGHIAKFKEIRVIAGLSPAAAEQEPAPRGGHARYALEGSVQIENDRLRLSARLLSSSDGSVVWANSYHENLSVRELLEAESDIARRVATAVAQPYGIIFHADAVRLVNRPPDNWEAYACTLAYYAYRGDLDPQAHGLVRECLERAVERFPAYATAWALLSLTYLDELRFRYRTAAATPALGRAAEAARRAVELDPENVRGLQAQMISHFFDKEVDTALAIGARAVAINPHDTELVGEYGIRVALTGDWKRGGEIILGALARNSRPLGYFETPLALAFYMQGDYASAETWIRKANVQANPIYHIVAAAIFGASGAKEAAAAEREWLLANASELVAELGQEMEIRNMRAQDQAHFIDGLRKAGVPIPDL